MRPLNVHILNSFKNEVTNLIYSYLNPTKNHILFTFLPPIIISELYFLLLQHF